MLAKDENKKNALLIANKLNESQNNSEPPRSASGPMRDVWNLGDFGFAFTVTKCIPSRNLRIRALNKLKEMTSNLVVLEQIDKYLADDKKWDSDITDRIAFDLQSAREKLKAEVA